jgi:hypothetical protein
MRVMAMSTEIVNPLALTGKVSDPLSMNACLPVFILGAMAFAAEAITFCEVDQISVIKPQLVPILRIMAVEAPSHRFGMMKLDIRVLFFQDPFLSIYFHGRMAVAAGEHSFSHRRRHVLFNDWHGGGSEKKQQKQRSNCCIECSHDRPIAFPLEKRDLRYPYSILPNPKFQANISRFKLQPLLSKS